MTAFADTIKTTDVPDYTEERQQHPRIWWRNGQRQAKASGFFYTKESEFPEAPSKPWEAVNLYDDEGGYQALRLKIAVIIKRSQPAIFSQSQPTIWLSEWEKGATIYTEVLCFVSGIEQPVVWCMKGLTGKAFDGISKAYAAGLLRDASRVAGKPLPPWAFWLPIATKTGADNKVAYDDTGHGSTVTPPALYVPSKDAMDALFVGQDILSEGAKIHTEYVGWAKERRGNGVAITSDQHVAPTPRPPVKMEEAELPAWDGESF